MKILQALAWGRKKLNNSKIKTSNLDSEVLLAHAIKKSKEFLYTYPKKNLTKNQIKKIRQLIWQRAKFKPVAYLIGHKEFFGLNFYVDKNVLVPRPETELLVEQIIDQTKNKRLVIADIGTGSGAIAISLAKNLPLAKIYASDISAAALKIAKKNAKLNQAGIIFLQGDLLKPFANKNIDVLVANLPYLDADYKNLLNSSKTKSLKFEPDIALYGGKFGLEIYQKFFTQISNQKKQPKIIFCEIGHAYSKQLKALIKKVLPSYSFKILKDYNNKNRILVLKK